MKILPLEMLGMLAIVLAIGLMVSSTAQAQTCNNRKHNPVSCEPVNCTVLSTTCDIGDPSDPFDDKKDYLQCTNEDSGGYCNDYQLNRFCYPTTALDCNKYFSCGPGCNELVVAGCDTIPRANKGACPTPP